MSVALALVGVSVLGTWGIATIALIVSGIILIVAPGDAETVSSGLAVGIFLLISGLISGGLMQIVAMPLMGLDPPLPIKASSIISHDRMKEWANAGPLRSFPDGIATEVRLRSLRVAIVRQGEEVSAMAALCPHARLPLGSFPGAPLPRKAEKPSSPGSGAPATTRTAPRSRSSPAATACRMASL